MTTCRNFILFGLSLLFGSFSAVPAADHITHVSPTAGHLMREKLPDNLSLLKLNGAISSGKALRQNHSQISTLTPVEQWEEGKRLYKMGYFSQALATWKECWDNGKGKDLGEQQNHGVDLAVSEYLALNARLGRKAEISKVLEECSHRPFRGYAAQVLRQAKEGYLQMSSRPDLAFRCGPAALERIQEHENGRFIFNEELYNAKSTERGIALSELRDIAINAGMDVQVAKRSFGSEFILPAVIHWKLDHYAAIIEERNGLYHIEDSTFADSFWVEKEALESEASGYWLVPTGNLPSGWISVSDEEAGGIYGRGQVVSRDPSNTRLTDIQSARSSNCVGMAAYNAHLHLVSLRLQDTPLTWKSISGFEIPFTLYYNEKNFDVSGDASPRHGNFSPQWTHNWHSFLKLEYTPSDVLLSATLPGGGYEVYKTGIQIPTLAGGQIQDQPTQYSRTDGSRFILRWIGVTNGGVNETRISSVRLEMSDGTCYTYTHVSPNDNTKIYLTEIRPSGQAGLDFGWGQIIHLNYEVTPTGSRLIAIHDGTSSSSMSNQDRIKLYYYDTVGLLDETGISSSVTSDPLKILAAKDSSGRLAKFTYDGMGRLISITDAVSLVSSFTYEGTSDRVDSLTTPYGVSNFTRGTTNSASGLQDWLEMKDPLGMVERIEYNQGALGISRYEYPEPDRNLILIRSSQTQEFRNTFYWDKKASILGRNDYTKARIYHWLHGASSNESIGFLESYKDPLENRVYFNYPGMVQHEDATFSQTVTQFRPNKIAQVLPDGTTQLETFGYNSAGNMTYFVDAVGRETYFDYASNNIDLITVRRKQGQESVLLAQYEYADLNAPRLPSTIIDAAGYSTTFDYNSWGQPFFIRNAKNEETRFLYSSTGISVTGGLITLSNYGLLQKAYPSWTTSDNYLISIDYHPDSNLPKTRSFPQGLQETTTYDSLNRLVRVTYQDGSFEDFDYGGKLLLEKYTDRQGRILTYQYNGNQQTITVKGEGVDSKLGWCACGELQTLVDGEGRLTSWEYDVQGRLIGKKYPDGGSERFIYAPGSSRLVTWLRPDGQPVGYSYTKDDRLSRIDYGSSGLNAHFRYDSVHPRLTYAWTGTGSEDSGYVYTYHPYRSATATAPPPILGAGQVYQISGPLTDDIRDYSYDQLGRTSGFRLLRDDLSVTQQESYNYDSLGRLNTLIDGLGTTSYNYLPRSSYINYVDFAGGKFRSQFNYYTGTPYATSALLMNVDSQVNTLTVSGVTTELNRYIYGYGERVDGRIRQITESLGALPQIEKIYNYNGANRLSQATAGEFTDIYEYDRAGALKRKDIQGLTRSFSRQSGGQLHLQWKVGDVDRLRGTVSEPAQVMVNGQPAALRADLTYEATISASAFDAPVSISAKDVSNNTRTSTYQLDQRGTLKEYRYDAAGRRKYEGIAGNWVTYEWDLADRLSAIEYAVAPGTGGSRWEFTYDAFGQRIKIVEKTTSGIEVGKEFFVWANGQLVQKRNTSNTITRRYFTHGFVDGSGLGTTYLGLRDHLGSTRVVYDISTGTRVARYDYDAYGRLSLQEGAVQADHLFTGHYRHAASNLYLTHFRAYDSESGQWLSRDPLLYAETLSEGPDTYSYVGGDPVNSIDLWGLCAQSVSSASPKTAAAGSRGTGSGGPPRPPRKAPSSSNFDGGDAAENAAPAFRSWNQFQKGTAGQFASRGDAAKAWSVYKDANGIVTGSTRSIGARSEYLRSLADNPNTASWMKQWLREGRVPPGHQVDHIKPLSIGGADVPANMRLQGTDLHRIHHQFYDPWNW